MLLIKNMINLFICLKSHSKKTFFVLFASFLLCANASAEINFEYTFGGSERFSGNSFRISSDAESWAGFAAYLEDTNPYTFPYGGVVSFTASLATAGSADLRFKFEKQSHPNDEPSFYTSWVTVDSVVERIYTVEIPAQSSANTYQSFLLYLEQNNTFVIRDIVVRAFTDSSCQTVNSATEVLIEAECYASTTGLVQLENTTDVGGGKNVGYIEQFDSLVYSIDVPQSGNYLLNYRMASPADSSAGYDVRIDGQLVDVFSVPVTNGWQNWQTVEGRVISLDAGAQTLKLEANAAGTNINWFSLTQTNSAVDTPPADNDDSSNWQPIDSSKWFHQTQLPNGWGWYNSEQQHYTDELENSYTSNGTLKIVAKRENYSDQGHTKPFTSARLNSKFAFKYGKVEFRAKMPTNNGAGSWPAVWLLNRSVTEPGNYWGTQGFSSTNWPASGEIDILEHYSKNHGYASSAMHTTSSNGGTVNTLGRWVSNISQYHTYSMDWNADRIIFKIDGIEHYRYDPFTKNANTWPFDDHFYLILNVAVEREETTSDSFNSATMEVDYIRVYHHQTDELLWSDEFGDADSDNDGVADDFDAFPYDSSESVDTDNDGIGNNADTDDDGDGAADANDAFPLDNTESLDTDQDGVGNNADTDDDNDGVNDSVDIAPLDPNRFYESQMIYVSNVSIAPRGGQTSIDIEYDVTSNNNALTGVGFRFHFNSDELQFLETNDLLLTNMVNSNIQSFIDTDDFDNNSLTDQYISLAWADAFGGQWPSTELPTKLISLVFDVKPEVRNDIEYSNVGFSNTSNAAYHQISATGHDVKILASDWDFDQNGNADALTDGLLLLRYSFGIQGDSLTNDATAVDTPLTSDEIENILGGAAVSDIDGNGEVDALTDGILLLRYLFGIRGDSLVKDATAPNAVRSSIVDIESYINSYMPGVDSSPPQIVLNGNSIFPLALDIDYSDPGVTVIDNRDIQPVITVSGVVENTVGSYDVTYTATDAAGNSSSVTRTVIVDVAPTIDSFKFLSANNAYLMDDITLDFDSNVISGRIAENIPVNDLVASFEHNGASVSVNQVGQTDGVTANDFTPLVEYKVSKSNGVSQTYTVDLTKFTGLPIINITTDGNMPIESKEDYITGTVTVDGGRGFEDLESTVMEIRGRGNSTWGLHPKKPYQMKLDSKEKFLDMPKQKKWIFLAEHSDKSLLRNTVAFELGYLSSLDWTPKSEFAEVYINGDYSGTYNVSEKVEEKSARVDIGDEGFLLEKDTNAHGRIDPDDVYFSTTAYQGDSLIVIKSPDIDRINENDFNYLQDTRFIYISEHINNFENVLFGENFADPVNGYASFIDVNSFIDWFLINEIAKNVDARSFSSIYFTHIPGEKIKMGPIWDFDLGFGRVSNYFDNGPDGWHVREHAWISRLLNDPSFVIQVQNRFNNVYLANKQYILDKIDEKAELLQWSQQENFNTWQILGVPVWPGDEFSNELFASYDDAVNSLKQWYENRMDWLEQNIGSI